MKNDLNFVAQELINRDELKLARLVLAEKEANKLRYLSKKIGGAIKELAGISECESRERGWFLRCTEDVRPGVLALIQQHGLRLLQLRSEDPTLEEIYLKYFREA